MSRDEQARELLRKHAGCAPHGLGQSVKTTAAIRAVTEALRGASGGGKPFSRDDENGGVADAAAGDGAQYTAEALSTHAIDFLDRKADAWMMETGIARMVQSAATVFEKHAPADVLYRFNETLEALMHQTFVEGAFRAWSEIEEERTACTPDQFSENAKSSGDRAGAENAQVGDVERVARAIHDACGLCHGDDPDPFKPFTWEEAVADEYPVHAEHARTLARAALAVMPVAQLSEVRAALEPFAKIAPMVEHTDKRDGDVVHRQGHQGIYLELTKDDFRRAASIYAALARSGEGEGR